MKLQLKEVIALYHELNGVVRIEDGKSEVLVVGLLKQKASMKVKMYLQRLNKVVTEEVELFEKVRKEKIEAATVDGKIENPVALEAELQEVLKSEKEIEVKNLWTTPLTEQDLESISTEEFYEVFLKLVDQ